LKKQTPFSTHPHFLPSSLTTIPSSKPKYKQNKHAPPFFSHLFIFTPSFSLTHHYGTTKGVSLLEETQPEAKYGHVFANNSL
jgi:hypothetical protein